MAAPTPRRRRRGEFTDLLLRAFAVERDVVPIESLYREGDTSPSTPPPGQPHFDAPAPLGPLELVSHGEHLCQIADLISRSRSAIERDLRLYNLIGALRAASTPGPDPVAGALAVFARSTREALAGGVAARSTDELVAQLKAAGELLRSVADAGDRMQVSRRLLDVAHRLDQMRGVTGEAPPPTPQPEPDIVPIESLQYDAQPEDERDVVPIASLAPDPMPVEAGLGALEAKLPHAGAPGARPAGTAEPASIEALLGHPTPATTATAATAATADTIAIESLCYRGRSALVRADRRPAELAAEMAGRSDLTALRPLIQELIDLVPLALDES